MNTIEQQNEFRGWKVLPARLDVCQTAWFLGFKPHDIPVLTAAGLLKSLGHPIRNCVKHYATENLETLRRDEKWLARASDASARTGENETPATGDASAERTETTGSADGLTETAGPILRRMGRQLNDAAFRGLPLVTFQRR